MPHQDIKSRISSLTKKMSSDGSCRHCELPLIPPAFLLSQVHRVSTTPIPQHFTSVGLTQQFPSPQWWHVAQDPEYWSQKTLSGVSQSGPNTAHLSKVSCGPIIASGATPNAVVVILKRLRAARRVDCMIGSCIEVLMPYFSCAESMQDDGSLTGCQQCMLVSPFVVRSGLIEEIYIQVPKTRRRHRRFR
jgi:hypothetical protein